MRVAAGVGKDVRFWRYLKKIMAQKRMDLPLCNLQKTLAATEARIFKSKPVSNLYLLSS